MMKRRHILKLITVIGLFLQTGSQIFGQTHHVYLIGDAGEDKVPGKALKTLQKHLESDSNSTVVFLGDNAYPKGINTKGLDTLRQPYTHPDAANLMSQLRILKNYKGNVFFVTGNHDWKAQKRRNAFRSILNEKAVIETYANDSLAIKNKDSANFIFFSPENTSQLFQPVFFDNVPGLSIVFFDSQFFFQKNRGWNYKTRKNAMYNFFWYLDKGIETRVKAGRKIIIAAHHPVLTNGSHSKFRQPLRFIFNWTPFYFLGLAGVNRWLSQDIDQPFYEKYRKYYADVLDKYEGIIVAGGHDHNLQWIISGDDVHLVSGAGSKRKKLRKKKKFEAEYLNDTSEGFVKIMFEEGKRKIQFISEEDQILFEK